MRKQRMSLTRASRVPPVPLCCRGGSDVAQLLVTLLVSTLGIAGLTIRK
jgi:hypothetical protein